MLGEHRGHWFHTIGQRQGLRLGDGPWYVVAKDPHNNVLWVDHDAAAGASTRLLVEQPLLRRQPTANRIRVRIRHGEALLGAGWAESEPNVVTLDRAQPGVAAGQFAVLYEGEVCLGAGVIAGRRTSAAVEGESAA